MKRKEIKEQTKDEIYDKYVSGISLRKMEKEYPYSFTFIQKLVKSYKWDNQIKINYPSKINHIMIATCKKTNKIFYDYSNDSGAITKHIEKTFPHQPKISKYKRKSNEYETGKFWFDKYFDFSYIKNLNKKKCVYCSWETTDTDNKSGAYEKHLNIIHNININIYLKQYPHEINYFNENNIIPVDAIMCEICGKKMKMINHKHLVTHNISVDDYRLKYGDNLVSKTTHKKLSVSTTEQNKHMKKSKTSKAENEIKRFLVDNGIKIIQSSRKYLNGVEIDLLSTKHMIGIEYNGNLYHSEIYGKKNRSYHLNKSKLSDSVGISLYHIHEDEWENKNNLIKNKLLHIFKISNATKIGARKCIIKTIDSNMKNIFLDKNHIQGKDKSKTAIGAFHNDELVSVMTFNKPNHMRGHNDVEDMFELTRFAVDNNVIITGIANRLIKYFINEHKPKIIYSFADRRWTPNKNNNLYVNLGFKLVKILGPDYKYYNRKKHRSERLHKFGFGKSSLLKKFPEIYDENKTEWEMMRMLGYDRIWDCGKFKFELNI